MRIRAVIPFDPPGVKRAFGLCAVVMLMVLGLSPSLRAQDRFVLGGGVTNVLMTDHRSLGYLEFHSGWKALGLSPIAGFLADEDGDTYAYAGLRRDFRLSPRLCFIPSFSAGYYEFGKGHPPLGGPLEFHTTFRLDYDFNGRIRAGAAYGHISNANIYKSNPGTNSISLYLSIPLERAR